MPPSDDKSYIEELKKSLYSRTAPDVRTRRKLRFTEPNSDVPTGWDRPPQVENEPVELNKKYKNPSMSFFTKLFILSAIFCIAAVGIGAYLFFNGSNLISADNIQIDINGPVSISGGEPVSFDVKVTNRNNVDLELVDMSVEFPAGTTDPANTSQIMQNYRKLIGNIPSGGTAKETVRAVIFGEENLQKDITVLLTYGVKGSTSVFTKRQTYGVLISSSPINLTISNFREITSGQEFDIKLDIKSNSQQVLKNILLKAEFPFGYTFISSNIPALSGDTTWKIGDLPPAATRSLVIHGKLIGENSDFRAFNFSVGAQSAKEPKIIGTQYMAAQTDVTIQKPFISAKIKVAGEESLGDYVGQYNQSERVDIEWSNNLSSPVSNMQIVAKLSGSSYDKNSVEPGTGLFNSATGEIVWNQRTNPDFQIVSAGESDKVSFSLTPKDLSGTNSTVKPNLTIDVSIVGNRTQESGVPQALRSVVSQNIRIQPSVSLSGRIVRTTGPFINTGPIPPKAEQTTTYTVIWNVDSSADSIGKSQVTTTLPPHIKWMNAISPSDENITYDSNTGLVTWTINNAGSVQNGSRRKEVAFQIAFTPNVNHVGQSPILLNQTTLTALDNYTGTNLVSTQENLYTRFSTDPSYKDGDQKVVE